MRDVAWLLRALGHAKAWQGRCAPNPSVAALLVSGERLVSVGVHQGAGTAHAEVVALDAVQAIAEDAVLYVTLEPCSHSGRTPPCVDRIVASGIKRVVFAYYDPNPLVAGSGQQKLLAAGVACDFCPVEEIHHFYRSYAYWQRHGRPWVKAKIALTADHKIAGVGGRPLAITGQACARITHWGRATSDALLTTAKTLCCDDPAFNVRLPDYTDTKPVMVIDRCLSLLDRPDLRIWQTAKSLCLYHGKDRVVTDQVETRVVAQSAQGLDCQAVIDDIGHRGVHQLWVEVGAGYLQSLLAESCVNELLIYRSPLRVAEGLVLDLSPWCAIDQLHWQPAGEDEVALVTF